MERILNFVRKNIWNLIRRKRATYGEKSACLERNFLSTVIIYGKKDEKDKG